MLTPCMQCRRHIAEERCPFCGGVAAVRPDVPRTTRRISRAAVFAGALALPGCSGGEPAPAHTTTVAATSAEAAVPQPSDASTARPTDASPSPADAPATPDAPPLPADAGVAAAPAVGNATLTVFAHHPNSKQPVPRYMIQIGGAKGFARGAVTDANGRARFDNLKPGSYTVYWSSGGSRRTPPAQLRKPVTVTAGAKVEVDVDVHGVPDHPIITPYGAPSRRLRVV